MDIALCALQGSELEYAGAHNPLWIVRKGKITESELSGSEKLNIQEFGAYTLAEIKADKQPIGKYDQPLPYTNHNITTKAGDRIYIFSDGLADQFGGKLGKKLKSLNVKRFLISIQNYDMKSQGDSLSQHFEEWKGELQQVDDVCFIGVEV
jgi:serine phosphatase RsbU (regulator of sigma subunit)